MSAHKLWLFLLPCAENSTKSRYLSSLKTSLTWLRILWVSLPQDPALLSPNFTTRAPSVWCNSQPTQASLCKLWALVQMVWSRSALRILILEPSQLDTLRLSQSLSPINLTVTFTFSSRWSRPRVQWARIQKMQHKFNVFLTTASSLTIIRELWTPSLRKRLTSLSSQTLDLNLTQASCVLPVKGWQKIFKPPSNCKQHRALLRNQ